MAKVILATGAAGFVGSHCVYELLTNGYEVVAVDNCVNAIPGTRQAGDPSDQDPLPVSLKRVESLAGKKLLHFALIDLLDEAALDKLFSKFKVDAVIHFAALKAVGESTQIPLRYYRNNVSGTINLLEAMTKHGVKRFVFSSSATVYGVPNQLPIDETHPTGQSITNPYGKTKYMMEEILRDLCAAEKDLCVASLRYFNPVGAHPSGEIGEDPQGIPNNLVPFIAQVAVGRRPKLNVFGGDFKTRDGTGVRDYIHVMDLARGHVATMDKLFEKNWTGFIVFNLGSGSGVSVLEMVAAFEKASGKKIPYEIVDRRAGDVDAMYAEASKAEKELGWKAVQTLEEMCKDTWNWQSKYPMGFRTSSQ